MLFCILWYHVVFLAGHQRKIARLIVVSCVCIFEINKKSIELVRRQFLYTDTLLVTGCLSKFVVTSLGFGRCGNNFNSVISEHMLQIKFMTTVVLWGECHRTSLIISQHWFRYWLGAVRQQANTWFNVDTDLCHHMASLGHNELKHGRSGMVKRHWAMLVHLCMSPSWVPTCAVLITTLLAWAVSTTKNCSRGSPILVIETQLSSLGSLWLCLQWLQVPQMDMQSFVFSVIHLRPTCLTHFSSL